MLTHDEGLADVVGSVAAAAGVVPVRVASPGQAVGLLLVGADCATTMTPVPPSRGCEVVLVGEDAAGLAASSMAWDARVVTLPEGQSWLVQLLASGNEATGRLVCLLGAGGGVGTSTLAVGLAGALAPSRTVAVVDADPGSGGLDLLWGAEGEPGWRWPSLLAAEGELAGLRGPVLRVDGTTVVSHARTGAAPGPVALQAVVQALRREHDIVIVDAGRSAGVLDAMPAPDRLVLVAADRVQSLAAAGRLLDGIGAGLRARSGLALHGGAAGCGSAAELGVPLWSRIPVDTALARAAEIGVAPQVAAGRRWRRAVQVLAEALQ